MKLSVEKSFILFAMLCSFFITMEASIVKAISNSLFIASYSAKLLPLAWLALVPLNFLVVSGYNKYLPKMGCLKMFVISTAFTMALNLFAAFYLSSTQWLSFFLYLWKDIYIMLMFQQLWSVINSTISISKAKYLYGVFYGVGGIGSILGCMIPGFFAVQFGSEKLLLVTLPFYIVLITMYHFMLKARHHHPNTEKILLGQTSCSGFQDGIKQIVQSKTLLFILLLVAFMQIASTLLDFKFNSILEVLYPMKDIRTEYLGRFFSIVNGFNVFLQFIGSFLFIHVLGLKRSHVIIPLLLCTSTACMLAIPIFPLVAITYGSIKAIDYSIFGVIKEMLYIPLSLEEKFKAKSIIDIFAYRTSKACASILVIVLELLFSSYLQQLISVLLLFIFIFWLVSANILYKEEKSLA